MISGSGKLARPCHAKPKAGMVRSARKYHGNADQRDRLRMAKAIS
jgi:hypothetical protein